MAVGYFWRKGTHDFRWKLEVEFSSQPGYKYNFTNRDFAEEGNPVLELAYALTVHRRKEASSAPSSSSCPIRAAYSLVNSSTPP